MSKYGKETPNRKQLSLMEIPCEMVYKKGLSKINQLK